jgi:hypothetical protein
LTRGDDGSHLLQKYLKAIDKDRKPYTLEVDEVKVNESLMKRELSRSDVSPAIKALSRDADHAGTAK